MDWEEGETQVGMWLTRGTRLKLVHLTFLLPFTATYLKVLPLPSSFNFSFLTL